MGCISMQCMWVGGRGVGVMNGRGVSTWHTGLVLFTIPFLFSMSNFSSKQSDFSHKLSIKHTEGIFFGSYRRALCPQKNPYELARPVADPGFPRRGRRQPLNLGQKPFIWQNLYPKLHENERNWTGGRGHIPGTPEFANADCCVTDFPYLKFIPIDHFNLL